MDANHIPRLAIDAELATLGEAMRVLRSRRNELAPISRLYPEILEEIFCVFASLCAETSEHPEECSRVSHVSRNWHTVALCCPRMWVNISTSSPAWTEAMLTRSKTLPISINSKWGHRSTETALRQICRIRELDLSGTHRYISHITRAAEGPAPHLETLCVDSNPQTECAAIPLEVSSLRMPRLRSLSLSGYKLRKNTVLPWSLTSLSITGAYHHPLPSLAELLGSLRHAHLLVDLSLTHCVLPDGEERVDVEVMTLSHLENFFISGVTLHCAQILERIRFPPDVQLSLEVMSEKTTAAWRSRLATEINRHVSAKYADELWLLSQRTEIPSVSISIHHKDYESGMDKLSLSLVIAGPYLAHNVVILHHLARSILSDKFLQGVEVLRFSTDQEATLQGQLIFNLLRVANFPDVCSLVLDGGIANSFLLSLDPENISTGRSVGDRSSPAEVSPGTSARLWMPCLDTLTLCGTHYDDVVLANTLRRRCQRGRMLSDLIINGRHLEQNLVDKLRPNVQFLDWVPITDTVDVNTWTRLRGEQY